MIQKKLKQCSKCPPGELRVLFRSNPPLCRYHAQMETAKKQASINKEKHDELDIFYRYIHEKYNYTCQETGKNLTYNNKHCAHILAKSHYPYFVLDSRNAILVNWTTHSIIDKGSPNQRKELKVWDTIQQTRKKLLEEAGLTFNAEHWENVTY